MSSIVEKINEDILDTAADSSKKAYERYKAMYLEMNVEVHTEESVLAFLLYCKEKRGYKSTTLWTVRSLIISYHY
jgi:hypothetical protein